MIYLIELSDGLSDETMLDNSVHPTYDRAMAWLEKYFGDLGEYDMDPEIDRILVWALPGETNVHRNNPWLTWHCSGTKYDNRAKDLGFDIPQGRLPEHQHTLFSETIRLKHEDV